MGIIKTINEIVRDSLNECVDILAKQYMKSVRPIYGSTEHGKPSHIGSCVLLEVDDSSYLITAAHVIDHNDNTTLYISGENDLVQIEGEALTTKPNTGNRSDDKLDFAILPLSADIKTRLGEVVFIGESSISNVPPERKGQPYLALGFPTSKNKKVNTPDKKVTQNPFVYSSTLNLDDNVFKEIGATKSHHYLLNFCSKHSKDENNNVVNSISPTGASGGALFFIEGMNSPDNYRPNADYSGILAGILIENHKQQKVIMATKISVVLNALTNIFSGRTKDARR